MKTIVIYYTAALGYGHKRAAEVISEEWQKQFPHDRVILSDGLRVVTPLLNPVVRILYSIALQYTPKWYAKRYKETGKTIPFINFIKKRYETNLKEYNPDIIITTQAFPAAIVNRLETSAKRVAVLTDYHLHKRWVNENFDIFSVPTQEIKDQLHKKGIAKEKIHITGIPIKKFTGNRKKEKHILIAGGGAGLVPFEKIVKEIDTCGYPLMILLGKNNKIEKKLEKYPVTVKGFVTDIEKYYNESIIVITKPGGLTTTELMTMQKPMILIDPLPGQEEANTQYLVNKGIAIHAKNMKELQEQLYFLLENKQKREEMKKKAGELGGSEAVVKIIQLLQDNQP